MITDGLYRRYSNKKLTTQDIIDYCLLALARLDPSNVHDKKLGELIQDLIHGDEIDNSGEDEYCERYHDVPDLYRGCLHCKQGVSAAHQRQAEIQEILTWYNAELTKRDASFAYGLEAEDLEDL
ncbi:hypothetical protein PMIN03_010361 [Paraphaeosphaeria minitans]